MIFALLNQKGGVGKTTLATHIAGELAMRGQHVVLLDADPQGSSLDWTQRRSQQGLPRLFSAVGLARETLHQEAPELARRADHVIIDGPPRIAALARSALLAAERVLIPVQPSPYDLWASAEMVALIREAQVFRPALRAAFVINRRVSTTIIGGKHGNRWPNSRCPRCARSAPAHRLRRQRGRWPARPRDGARQRRRPRDRRAGGRTAAVADMTGKPPPAQQARRHRRASARESARRGVDSPGRRRCAGQKGDLYTARLTLDITPAMRARIKVSAFTQGVTVAELLRGLLERSFRRARHERIRFDRPHPKACAHGCTAAGAFDTRRPAGNVPLTRVALAYIEPRFKLYLRFGEPRARSSSTAGGAAPCSCRARCSAASAGRPTTTARSAGSSW
jgi:chromosome partitioning protein